MDKKILGLDLGTNSIGWALVEQNFEEKKGNILGVGCRILPMSQDVLGKFDSGQSISQTAERTRLRGIRRLRERHLLRRERLHRVLNILNFLPKHYANEIDFKNRPGQFIPEREPKIAYSSCEEKHAEFIFKNSFNEMLLDFKKYQPQLFYKKASGEETKIPYDWTIYYLRKKAISEKIEKEELAWILLNFNQKRGYYQLRGEDNEEQDGKEKSYEVLKVSEVIDSGEKIKGKNLILYNVFFENGWKYDKQVVKPEDWIGKTKEFVVTTSVLSTGEIKRSFKTVDSEQDWIAIKKKTEKEVTVSNKTVGTYIYDTLLRKPDQKIRGKLIRTIERQFYKKELVQILEKQKEFYPELRDHNLYKQCLNELYKQNEPHKINISQRDFTYLFVDDIIFYQRPLKSKKSLISDCSLEFRNRKNEQGEIVKTPLKCVAKSHPLYQEFRLLQWMKNLKIFKKTGTVDIDITNQLIGNEEDKITLYLWLNDKTEITQEEFLKYPAFGLENKIKDGLDPEEFKKFKKDKEKGLSNFYRWNYVEDKRYPLNETRGEILKRLLKCKVQPEFLSKENEERLWHLLYSVVDKIEIEKALNKYVEKHNLPAEFVEVFKKFPPYKKEYGAYSLKAINKLLSLMRFGKYWNPENIDAKTSIRIEKIITGEYDKNIRDRVRDKAIHLNNIGDFKDLPLWLASYIIYDRHSETGEISYWNTPSDIQLLKQHSLRNPIVEQVINETLQVIKDIWQEYGNGKEEFFDEIHVELGREMKNPADKRAQITRQIAENENTNLRLKALLMELAQDQTIENVRPYSPIQQEILKIYEEGIYLNENNESEKEEIEKIRKKNQPTSSELKRYKLWLEQGYKSPYTGAIIPLSKLFTPAYEIEHIIPQSRYFDDSLSNKIICEAEVNKIKDNQLAYEFIKNNQGLKIELSHGKFVQVYDLQSYEQNVKQYFGKNKSKMTKLLLEEIPESFIERNLNDSRYISKVVKSLLSNIVREEGESEAVAKNVISSNGSITSRLKQDWGLNDIWIELISPRFERLNKMTGTLDYGKINENTGKFLPQVPLELSKGFSKKRIDHRHHALDALVVACTTRNHINYLNNESASENKKSERFDLRNKLRHLEEYTDSSGKRRVIAKEFIKPWPDFAKAAKDKLNKLIVSFKSNNRVINKTVNLYQKWETDSYGSKRKVYVKQTKGDSWAIRKPLHKDTVSGLVNLQFKKSVNLSAAIDTPENIVNKELRSKIKALIKEGYDKKKMLHYFKAEKNLFNGLDISKVEIYYYTNENKNTQLAASRVKLDESFSAKKIESITDRGIQKILLRHLDNYSNNLDENRKPVAPEVLAFSPEGIEALNSNLAALNDGKLHAPIFKVRTYETFGNKFNIGTRGNKKYKFAEAAKGTNLFFAIYSDENGNRSYETIPLNVVIERQKQGLSPVPEQDENGNHLLFHLSPNDLVYVPSKEESENPALVDFRNLSYKQVLKIYKFVSCTGVEGHFVQNFHSFEIVKNENGTNSKSERILDFYDGNTYLDIKNNPVQIKSVCWKLNVDRLGIIQSVYSPLKNNYPPTKQKNRIDTISEPASTYLTNPKLSYFSDLLSLSDAESKAISSLSMEERLKKGIDLIRRIYGDQDISRDFPGKITIKKSKS
jgi:CRISPR-associated endonuclease Csn1